MSDYIVYDTEEELREVLSDIQEQMNEFKMRQEKIDEQRGVLADQVRGATAILEKQLSDYELKRDDLDQQQTQLAEDREPYEVRRDQLQQQIDAKQDAKLGRSKASAEGQDPKKEKEAKQSQGGASQKTSGPLTRKDIEKLKEQLSKPKLDLTLDPPGGISQASTIAKDLKLMAEIRAKEEKFDNASQNLRENWDRSSGPKR